MVVVWPAFANLGCSESRFVALIGRDTTAHSVETEVDQQAHRKSTASALPAVSAKQKGATPKCYSSNATHSHRTPSERGKEGRCFFPLSKRIRRGPQTAIGGVSGREEPNNRPPLGGDASAWLRLTGIVSLAG